MLIAFVCGRAGWDLFGGIGKFWRVAMSFEQPLELVGAGREAIGLFSIAGTLKLKLTRGGCFRIPRQHVRLC